MPATSIRVSRVTQQKLKEIAQKEQKSIGAVVDDFVTDYERKAFREQMQADFRALRGDPAAWNEYRAETELWDQTAGDGLDNEPRFFEDEERQ